MKLLIDFFEANIDKFERMFSQRYVKEHGLKHDYVYFCCDHRYNSDDRELKYEAHVVLARLDNTRSTKELKIFYSGSFSCLAINKAPSEQELISKFQQLIEEHEGVHKEKN